MSLAGYEPSRAGFKSVMESRHVKKRMQDLRERVLCDGWRQAADIVVEDPTKEDVIKKLWEFATSVSPPAAAQVTALNALAKHYGISVGVEDEKGGGGARTTGLPPFTSASRPASSRRRPRTGPPSVRPMSNLPRVRLRKPAPARRLRLPTLPTMIPPLPWRDGRAGRFIAPPDLRRAPHSGHGNPSRCAYRFAIRIATSPLRASDSSSSRAIEAQVRPPRLEPVSLPPRVRPRPTPPLRTPNRRRIIIFLGARRSRASSVGTYHASRLSPPRAASSANRRAPAMSHPGHQRHARSQSAFRIRPRLSRTRSAAEPAGGATHSILSTPRPVHLCPPYFVPPLLSTYGEIVALGCVVARHKTRAGRRLAPPPVLRGWPVVRALDGPAWGELLRSSPRWPWASGPGVARCRPRLRGSAAAAVEVRQGGRRVGTAPGSSPSRCHASCAGSRCCGFA